LVDATDVFFYTGPGGSPSVGKVYRAPKAGGSPTVVGTAMAGNQFAINALAINDMSVFWIQTDGFLGFVYMASKADAGASLIGDATATISYADDLIADDCNVYYAHSAPLGGLVRQNIQAGTHVTTGYNGGALVMDSSNVYASQLTAIVKDPK
jgi:hypothetical protein